MRDEMLQEMYFQSSESFIAFGKDKSCIQTTNILSYEIGAYLIELKSLQGEGKEGIVFYS